MIIEDFLPRLDNVTENENGWMASCPGHPDENPSLSIAEGEDGQILLNDFGGCTTADIVAKMGLKMSDLRGNRKGRKNAKQEPTFQPNPDGLTLEEYAKYTALPITFLKKIGLSEWNGSVRIPYFNTDGIEAAVRFRHSIGGPNKSTWKRGTKTLLYGVGFLDQYRKGPYDWIILVEGESDTQTLIHHNIPALGLPGATNWKEDRDASLFDGFKKIYVVIEPDQGGEAVKKWVAKSAIRDRVRFVTLGPHKDVSALHKSDVVSENPRFRKTLFDFLNESVPFAKVEEADQKAKSDAAWEACKGVANDPDILARFVADLKRAGVVGEDRSGKLLYLILTSRLLLKPVSAVMKGVSSAGKSNLVKGVSGFFPPEAFYALSSMSERALIYSEESLQHRTFILYEAAGVAGDFADYLMRTLLSEGHLRYETVMKTANGLEAVLIEREGPTNLLVTTTDHSLHPENETRMLSIPIDDSPKQTSRVMEDTAAEDDREAVEIDTWHAFQVWLPGQDNRVTIPYAVPLALLIPPLAVRLRRDFRAVLSLIHTHALLHQATRERDAQGRIVATLDDYAAVYDAVATLIEEGIEATVPESIRETVKAVSDLLASDGNDLLLTSVSLPRVAERLGLDKSTTSRRVQAAIGKEYIRNEEWRRGRPAKLVLGNALPEEIAVLPSVKTLTAAIHHAAPEPDAEPSSSDDKPHEPVGSARRVNPFGRDLHNPSRASPSGSP